MKTIEELRKAGFKVRVIHHRFVAPHLYKDKPALVPIATIKLNNLDLMAKGGSTRIELRSPDGIEVFGEAHCSKVDTFNRKVGNVKALGRALGALEAIQTTAGSGVILG